MTTGLLSLGSVEDLWDAGWSGFAYPPRRSYLELLENEVGSSGNVVIQDGPLTRRRGSLSFTARDRDERDTVRGYDEDGTSVEFVDEDGSSCTVLVYNFRARWMKGDLWSVDVDLVQLSEPIPPGS